MRSKGFTLIELLAVIVILAIIALIAVPIILNIINDSKRNAVIRSGELYLDAVNQAIARKNLTEEFNPSTCEIQSDGNLICDGDKNLTVETNGERPKSGTITFEDGIVKNVKDMELGDYELETDPKTGRLRIKESDKEPPVIINVTFKENEITVEAKDNSNGKLYYSFDGGETYIEENTFEVTESGTYTIYVKDEAGNVSEPEEITVTYNPSICKLYKPNTTPNAPDLYNNTLTPVIYDEDYDNGEGNPKGAWLVADTTKEWYDYSKQEWANAVILNTGVSRTTGQVVDVEEDVRAMFVWIPRYEYRIEETEYGKYGKCGTSADSPGAIDIRFISSSTTTASSDEYYLHPAFWWDKDDDGIKDNDEWLSGIWVGKFETSAEKGSACYTNLLHCNNTNQNPYILPNANSLRYQTASKQFATAQKFTPLLSGADAHMAKNSEWGAAAYLTQSIYGKYGYDGKEVTPNSCSSYTTGVTTCSNTYETIAGQKASTTGNIYGIYDMSGGAHECVMGYLITAYGSLPWGSTSEGNYAGFTSIPLPKYFDGYTVTSNALCTEEECKGHAMYETAGWYSDYSGFVVSRFPWFMRGGSYSSASNAGVFNLDYGAGHANYYSFRVVLVKGD